MIAFDNVNLTLNKRDIIKDLSFEIKPGEIVLLVGGSGAGKSTILRLILRLIRQNSGDIRILEKSITNLPEKELNRVRQQIGLVFQEGALFDSLTVEENVGLFLIENLKLPMEEVHRRVTSVLEVLGLSEFLNYFPSELSGGMKKRVAIARAIVSDPKILLYDEPTAGLDPVTAKRVVNLINTLQHQYHVTSLIVTHEVHYFLDIADRLLMLRQGKLVYNGVPDLAVLEEYETPETLSITQLGKINGNS